MRPWPTRDVQRVIGKVLIPEVRASQTDLPEMAHSLPIALELFYTALAMKPAYHVAGTIVARRYAERMGLDSGQVEAFALHRIAQEVGSDG
jgi:hypothetical protein